MVPSSPYGPCSTGNTTSTSMPAAGAPSAEVSTAAPGPAVSSGTSAAAVGSAGITTEAPLVTVGSRRPARTGIAAGSICSQLPSGVIPTAVTSNSSVSTLASTPAAEMQDTGCSPLRPPKTTATRMREGLMASHLRVPSPAPGRPARDSPGGRIRTRAPTTSPPTVGNRDRLLGRVRPIGQVPDHLRRRQVAVADLVHAFGDRHVDLVTQRKIAHRTEAHHALGHLPTRRLHRRLQPDAGGPVS